MNADKFLNIPYHVGQIEALTERIREELRASKADHDEITKWTRRIDDIAELIFNNIPHEVQ